MEDVMSITPLGSGQEVGRSCHLLEFRDLTILLDCGIHPGYDGLNGLPFFDRVEPEQVDVLLITHFHLDHVASLPYFTERTGFVGRIFMTHPTKAVTRLLLGDYLRLMSIKRGGGGGGGGGDSSAGAGGGTTGSSTTDNDVLYTESELQSCVDKIELVDYHQVVTVCNGKLKFIPYNAGHVLGAAMFLLEIGGRTVLYTGDYSMEDDRHLMAAEVPPGNIRPDVLMVESTYGVQVHASRQEREARFTGTVERVVSRGGRCLIPVFALGRAQELLLILDEYWQANPQLQSIPIWYASKLASKALRVYQTYANMMNARIRASMDISNPFAFRYIRNLKSIDVETFDDRGPSVVFASPGMLQSGVSRQLFDRWCTDPKNGVLIAGYAVENTLAKEIMNQPKEVVSLEGRRQPLSCLVDYVSFSAHVDFMQNRNFISKVNPRHIILVHGQKDEMGRLKSALMLQYKQLPESKRPTITMPPNLQDVKLKFSRRRSAKVMGSLAMKKQKKKKKRKDGGRKKKKKKSNSPQKESSSSLLSQTPFVHDVDNDEKDKQQQEEDDDDIDENDDDDEHDEDNEDNENDDDHDDHHPYEPQEGEEVNGILVTQNFHSKLVSPDDLSTYTQLRVGSVSSRLHVPFVGGTSNVGTLRLFLNEMFTGVTERVEERSEMEVDDNDGDDDDMQKVNGPVITFGLHDDQVLIITGKSYGIATVEWDANPVTDLLADSVVALLMHAQSSSASIRLTSQPCGGGGGAGHNGNKRKKRVRGDEEEADDDDDDDNKIEKEGEGEDDEQEEQRQEEEESANMGRLRLIHDVLLEQFENVDATYKEENLPQEKKKKKTKKTQDDDDDDDTPQQQDDEQQQQEEEQQQRDQQQEETKKYYCMGKYTISTDAGLELPPIVEEGEMLICTVIVEFYNIHGVDAKVTVQCDDDMKLASNVRECILNIAIAASPIKL